MQLIDVSSWQHPDEQAIDWSAVKAAGVEGVYVKVTEGSGYVNPWAARDVEGAKAAGLRVGGYHFAQFRTSPPDTEAAWYMAQAAPLGLDLPHALDLETGMEAGWDQLALWGQRWFVACEIGPGAGCLYVNR